MQILNLILTINALIYSIYKHEQLLVLFQEQSIVAVILMSKYKIFLFKESFIQYFQHLNFTWED